MPSSLTVKVRFEFVFRDVAKGLAVDRFESALIEFRVMDHKPWFDSALHHMVRGSAHHSEPVEGQIHSAGLRCSPD